MGAYSLVNIVLVAVGVAFPGWVGLWAIFATSFFMSVMFPTIFALGIDGLDQNTKIGGSLIMMAIVGGAVLTPLMGWISETQHSIAQSLPGAPSSVSAVSLLLLCRSPHEAEGGFTAMTRAILVTSLLMMAGWPPSRNRPRQIGKQGWGKDATARPSQLDHDCGFGVPLQSSAGVETIETNTDQMEVIRKVLSAIDSSIHVRPIVYMDAELPFVPEKDAPGVTSLPRRELRLRSREGRSRLAPRADHRQSRRGREDIPHPVS